MYSLAGMLGDNREAIVLYVLSTVQQSIIGCAGIDVSPQMRDRPAYRSLPASMGRDKFTHSPMGPRPPSMAPPSRSGVPALWLLFLPTGLGLPAPMVALKQCQGICSSPEACCVHVLRVCCPFILRESAILQQRSGFCKIRRSSSRKRTWYAAGPRENGEESQGSNQASETGSNAAENHQSTAESLAAKAPPAVLKSGIASYPEMGPPPAFAYPAPGKSLRSVRYPNAQNCQ